MTESSAAGLLGRLKRGLGRTAGRLAGGIERLLAGRRLDAETLAGIEELLIAGDVGVVTAAKLAGALAKGRFPETAAPGDVLAGLAADIAAVLRPVARPLVLDPAARPHVVLVAGVNGSGKTTTIGKLAKMMREEGRAAVLVAADTFRAAAVEQLEAWGARAGAPVVAGRPGADPAGLAYDALRRARDEGADVLFIDTAGRLQNKAHLMAELEKVVRVVKKVDAQAPHSCLLVLDAGVGQNAHSQVETFREMVSVTGLVLTKLDGTAKGGVVVALAQRFGLPIHYVGVGEGIDDLRPFEAEPFARALLGLD
jgi:fused signal recognition particle receptor